MLIRRAFAQRAAYALPRSKPATPLARDAQHDDNDGEDEAEIEGDNEGAGEDAEREPSNDDRQEGAAGRANVGVPFELSPIAAF